MREIASVYAARTKRRLIVGCISALVDLPAMACCLTLIVTVLFPALDNLAKAGNQNNAMYAILGVGALALTGLFALPLGIFVVLTIRRACALDAIFTPLGLTGQAYMLNGRHYQGQINGRILDVYIYRGPTVEFRLKANVQTQVQVLPGASTGGLQNKAPMTTGLAGHPAFSIYPTDEGWTQALLADGRTLITLQTLMTTGADWAIFRRVEILPGEVLFHLNRSRQDVYQPNRTRHRTGLAECSASFCTGGRRSTRA